MRRFRRSTRRGPRPKYEWENATENVVANLLTGTSTITSLAPTDQGAFQERQAGLLLVRTLGNILVHPNNLAVNSSVRVSAGIMVVTTDAFAAGATSIPRPDIANPQWAWNETRSFEYRDGQSEAGFNMQVVSKAMRKITGLNNVLMLIVRNISASVAIDLDINVRVLYRLP